MTTSKPTWAIVATVDEHPALLRAFVAWHLRLGASAVYLYFDRPDDPAASLFADMSGVKTVLCDQTYWDRHAKGRPVRHQIRQTRNANRAYRRAEADWLLHIDADEFLWPVRSVADHLADVYPWTDAAVVPVAERIYVEGQDRPHVFTGAFRRPEKGVATPDDITARGLTGHAIGKSFARVGKDLSLSIHRPQRKEPAIRIAPLHGLELLHFDGLTRLQWIYKLLRKADAFANGGGMTPSPHRQRQIDHVLGDPKTAFALHDNLKVTTAEQRRVLHEKGLLLDVCFDPSETMTGTGELLRPAELDAWILDREGDALGLLRALT